MESCNTPACQSAREIFHELEEYYEDHNLYFRTIGSVLEAANAPTTPRAERYLLDKGIEVLPAILCNAGGVTVSYFEWKQNRQSETWD